MFFSPCLYTSLQISSFHRDSRYSGLGIILTWFFSPMTLSLNVHWIRYSANEFGAMEWATTFTGNSVSCQTWALGPCYCLSLVTWANHPGTKKKENQNLTCSVRLWSGVGHLPGVPLSEHPCEERCLPRITLWQLLMWWTGLCGQVVKTHNNPSLYQLNYLVEVRVQWACQGGGL